MFVATRHLASASAPDFIVVGSGPAGLTLAMDLAAGDASVLLLESGGRWASRRSLSEVEAVGQPFNGGEARGRTFGGTGQLWAGQCLRLDSLDYRERPWVEGSGWPVDEAALEPWLARAERLLLVDSWSEDAADAAMPAARGAFDPAIAEWRSTVYSPDHRVGSRFRREIAALRRLTCVTDATVTEILVDAAGESAIGIELRDRAGRRQRVHSSAVILCCGSIENARLLLASRSRVSRGLGNASNWVGRGFQDHPFTFAAEVGNASPDVDAMYQSVWAGGYRSRPRTTLTAAIQSAEQVLNVIVDLELLYEPSSVTGAMKRLHHAVSERQRLETPLADLALLASHPGLPARLAADRLRRNRSMGSQATQLEPPARRLVRVQTEQPPLGPSAVKLSLRNDRYGEPLATVDWRVGSQEWKTTRVAVDFMAEQFRQARLGEIRPQPWLSDFQSWRAHAQDFNHHAGTTRMSKSEVHGVVDTNSQVHGVADLFVTGGSVFPTSGYANPTLTIVALAARLANYLLHRR